MYKQRLQIPIRGFFHWKKKKVEIHLQLIQRGQLAQQNLGS